MGGLGTARRVNTQYDRGANGDMLTAGFDLTAEELGGICSPRVTHISGNNRAQTETWMS